eukprot:11671206-Karenia_brevis.AAC.1
MLLVWQLQSFEANGKSIFKMCCHILFISLTTSWDAVWRKAKAKMQGIQTTTRLANIFLSSGICNT